MRNIEFESADDTLGGPCSSGPTTQNKHNYSQSNSRLKINKFLLALHPKGFRGSNDLNPGMQASQLVPVTKSLH